MPVGVAKTALPEALVTQTKAIGVILPPPDIRAIVDKTVGARAALQGRWCRTAAWPGAAAASPPPAAVACSRFAPACVLLTTVLVRPLSCHRLLQAQFVARNGECGVATARSAAVSMLCLCTCERLVCSFVLQLLTPAAAARRHGL